MLSDVEENFQCYNSSIDQVITDYWFGAQKLKYLVRMMGVAVCVPIILNTRSVIFADCVSF
jgi:hypothetical protein